MQPTPEILLLIQQLQDKYNQTGQDMRGYLEGLLYSNYLTYWDYIEIDTLLTLQKPRTPIKDELIFIVYHQITELYFRLVLHEMEQIAERKGNIEVMFFIARLMRMNSYFRNLIHSFEIMVDGMEREQFLKFRMSLLPASGFQSAQYRMIEICATNLIHLVDKDHRDKVTESSGFEEKFNYIYWKAGATELSSGKKTFTLTQFEQKYSDKLMQTALEYKDTNLLAVYLAMPEADRNHEDLIGQLRVFDSFVNVHWPLAHYKSAARYLQKNPTDIAATGGTNWQKYLPPRFQKRIFYPMLWTEEEKSDWGKSAFR